MYSRGHVSKLEATNLVVEPVEHWTGEKGSHFRTARLYLCMDTRSSGSIHFHTLKTRFKSETDYLTVVQIGSLNLEIVVAPELLLGNRRIVAGHGVASGSSTPI